MIAVGSQSFKILNPIGEGGQFQVYKASLEGQVYALAQEQLTTPTKKLQAEEFGRVVKALGKPPNIISIFFDHIDNDYHRFVMEYFPAGDLHTVLFDQGEVSRLAPHQLNGIQRQLLLGLRELHQKKIIHRDIKTNNVLVESWRSGRGKHYRVVIADLGYACFDDSNSLRFPYGSFGYNAPEVLQRRVDTLSGKAIDTLPPLTSKVDIFAMGVLIYQIRAVLPLPWWNPQFCQNSNDELLDPTKFKGFIERIIKNHQEMELSWLKEMLDPDPSTRSTIEQTFIAFEKAHTTR